MTDALPKFYTADEPLPPGVKPGKYWHDEAYQSLRADLAACQERLTAMERAADEIQQNNDEAHRNDLDQCDKVIQEQQGQLAALEAKLAACQDDVEKWRNRYNEVVADATKMQAKLTACERELAKWQAPFDPEQFEAAKQQADHSGSLAAQGVYITALEHALKHQRERAEALERERTEWGDKGIAVEKEIREKFPHTNCLSNGGWLFVRFVAKAEAEEHQRAKARAERLERALELYKHASYQSHSGHFDKTGMSGAGCPECIKASELREQAQDALKEGS